MTHFTLRRLNPTPVIHVADDPALGRNVNGPALLRVPDWVSGRLGQYYLYFAHHEGHQIRLAYADTLAGPWLLHRPGALRLDRSQFPTEDVAYADLSEQSRQRVDAGTDGRYAHIASPDIVVDHASHTMRLYYHGRLADGSQMTRVAVSPDGLTFEARQEVLGHPYFRVFRYRAYWYALAMPGLVYRSTDGLSAFETGPRLFANDMRHSALLRRDNRLYVFWTRVGDAPERMLVSSVDLAPDWLAWHESDAVEVLRPELSWEGAELAVEPSRRGGIMTPVNQLRDPAILDEGERITLGYSGAGEQGLGLADVQIAT